MTTNAELGSPEWKEQFNKRAAALAAASPARQPTRQEPSADEGQSDYPAVAITPYGSAPVGIHRGPAFELAKRPALGRRSPPHVDRVDESAFTHLRVEVLDADAVFALDPGLEEGQVVRLVCSITEPLTVARDGVEVLRLAPVDKGSAPDVYDVSLAVLDAIVAAIGIEDNGETSELLAEDARASVRGVLRGLPSTTFALRAKCDEARRRQAADIARAHGLDPAEVEQLTGVSCTPGARRLLKVKADRWRAIEEERRRAQERVEAQAAEHARIAAEAAAPNAKTLGALGLIGFRVSPAIGMTSARNPRDGGGNEISLPIELAGGTFRAWTYEDGSEVHIVSAPPGIAFDVECPSGGHFVGLASSTVIPAPSGTISAIAQRDSMSDGPWSLVQALRRRQPDYLRISGPVGRFSLKGIDRAKELVEEHAKALYMMPHGRSWRRYWLIEALIRGCRVPAVRAAKMLWQAVLEAHAREWPSSFEVPSLKGGKKPETGAHEPGMVQSFGPDGDRVRFPHKRTVTREVPRIEATGTAMQKDAIERACLRAEVSGDMEPGILIGDVEKQEKALSEASVVGSSPVESKARKHSK